MSDDVKVFRFSVEIPLPKVLDIRSVDGPIPIYNDSNKLLGFGSIGIFMTYITAKCAIDPACPERLDIETGTRKYWLDASVTYRGSLHRDWNPTVLLVQKFVLTTKEVLGQEPIRGRFHDFYD